MFGLLGGTIMFTFQFPFAVIMEVPMELQIPDEAKAALISLLAWLMIELAKYLRSKYPFFSFLESDKVKSLLPIIGAILAGALGKASGVAESASDMLAIGGSPILFHKLLRALGKKD